MRYQSWPKSIYIFSIGDCPGLAQGAFKAIGDKCKNEVLLLGPHRVRVMGYDKDRNIKLSDFIKIYPDEVSIVIQNWKENFGSFWP